MYVPDHFAEHRPEQLHRVMREHPLATLVVQGEDGLDADHLPFEFDAAGGPHGRLLAHVARANPLWRRPAGTPVLAVFRGAQGYVSPNGLPSKHEHHRQVPTWNYEVVHAHGLLRIHDDERFLRGLLARLTRHHEAPEARPWKMGDSAPDFIDGMLRNIVGIEIAITALTGKFKLSQNKAAPDRHGIADHLQARGQDALADRVRLAGGS